MHLYRIFFQVEFQPEVSDFGFGEASIFSFCPISIFIVSNTIKEVRTNEPKLSFSSFVYTFVQSYKVKEQVAETQV